MRQSKQPTNHADEKVPPPIVRVWQSRPQTTPVYEQPTQQWQPEPIAAPRRDPFWQRFLLIVVLVTVLSLVGALLSSYALFAGSETIFPAVSAVGVNLGGMTQPEAITALQQVAQTPNMTVQAGAARQMVSLAQLGYTLDAAAMVSEAYERGRDPGNWRELPQAFLLGLDMAPIWQFDPLIAQTTLAAIATQAHIPPTPADLVYASGQVQITPGQPGSQLDIPAGLAWLQQQTPAGLVGRTLTLPMIAEEAPVNGLAEQSAAANAHLQHTLTIVAYDPISDETMTWAIPPSTWNQWVIARRMPDTPTGFVFALASNAVQDYFLLNEAYLPTNQYLQAEEAAANLLTAYENGIWQVSLRLYHTEQEHVVQAGESLSSIARDYGMPYPWLEQANPGVTNLYVGQTILIPSPDLFLPLPVVTNKRIIISISEQKMWAYENGALKWEWVISTGIADSPTASGVYQVQTHVDNAYAGNWDLWMPYFMGIYRPVPTSDFMNGFHGFPTRGSSQLLWTNSLGRPVTYGCILLSDENAAALYEWAEAGVVVEIQP